jgi:hypothetical protein
MGLTERQRRIAVALADTLFPSLGDGDPAGGEIIADKLDDLVAGLPAATQKGLGTALGLFQLLAVPTRGRRFTRMSPAARERYVEAWMRGGTTRRMVYRALRETLGTVYYQDPRAWAAIGYAGPQVKR